MMSTKNNGGSANEQAYAAIIDLILTQGLRPGERTSVYLLSKQIGLGRTPIKDAITRLEAEGVLLVSGRSGTTVRALDHEETRQLFALRRALEDFACDLAVENVSERMLSRLRKLLRELAQTSRNSADTVRAIRFVRANVEFHTLIVAAAKNPFLDRLYAQLQLQLQIVTYLTKRGHNPAAALQRQREHEAIVEALATRNASRLRRLLRTHAETTEKEILRSMTSRGKAPKAPAKRGSASRQQVAR